MKSITWTSKKIKIADIQKTPKNYKIKTDLGKEQLQASVKAFGLASNIVVNPLGNGKYVIVDGNSRYDDCKEKGVKEVWCSLPDRKLSPKEFKEMSALFDKLRAGEVDEEGILRDLGTTKDFFETYKLQVPAHLLENLGARATPVAVEKGTASKGKAPLGEVDPLGTFVIQLVFNTKQEAEFRKLEDKLSKKFKTETTAETVLKALKSIK